MNKDELIQNCYVSKKRRIKPSELSEVLYCNGCNFSCKKNSEWTRHVNTEKHKRVTEPNSINSKKHICNCGKGYVHLSSLYNHRKSCKNISNNIPNELLIELIKQNTDIQQQNKDLQNKILEISQTPHITNNIQNNVQNNFNLNMFLNEQCKDAISISDFIDSLQLEVSDLEATGKLGYVLGISRIFINKLKELDIHERPLHCTDIKRETVYIKDKDVWEKENTEKSTLKQVVKKIARKNLQQLPAWQEQNPDFTKLDTPENNEYIKISLNALGSYSSEEEEKDINKIMKNVLKEVVIEKK
jgi:NMD protein affecting ribosome stability and mRNA decay